jgi:hypothetical protein
MESPNNVNRTGAFVAAGSARNGDVNPITSALPRTKLATKANFINASPFDFHTGCLIQMTPPLSSRFQGISAAFATAPATEEKNLYLH